MALVSGSSTIPVVSVVSVVDDSLVALVELVLLVLDDDLTIDEVVGAAMILGVCIKLAEYSDSGITVSPNITASPLWIILFLISVLFFINIIHLPQS